MKNECREYAKHVAEEIEAYYNDTINEDGEEVSLYDYVADALDYAGLMQKSTPLAVTGAQSRQSSRLIGTCATNWKKLLRSIWNWTDNTSGFLKGFP